MSVDLSFMDLLFDKEDPVIGFDKDIKNDDLKPFFMDDKTLNNDDWVCNTDSFLDSIFQMDNESQPFELLQNYDLLSDKSVHDTFSNLETSSCSDSGMSSDQQMSPSVDENEIEIEDDVEIKEEIIELDSTDYDDMPSLKSEVAEEEDADEEDQDANEDVVVEEVPAVVVKPQQQLHHKPVFAVNPKKTIIQPQVHRVSPAVHSRVVDTDYQQQQQQQNKPCTPTRVKPIGVTNPSRHVLRVTPISAANPRSILIPVSVKSAGVGAGIGVGSTAGVRAIKIVNASGRAMMPTGGVGNAIRATKQITRVLRGAPLVSRSSTSERSSVSDTTDDEQAAMYPRLHLTAEEKRLMIKEGISLPSHYPLTKQEERELKRIRRKIRNKISAQDSRKRKKEYVDGLEDRVKQCTEENMTLMKRLKVLQSQNQSLSTQLKKLQAVVAKGTGMVHGGGGGGGQTAQPATCLMVLMLSLALVMAPNLRHARNATHRDLALPAPASAEHTFAGSDVDTMHGRSRTLLFTKPSALKADSQQQQQLSEADDAALVDAGTLISDLEELLQFNSNKQQLQQPGRSSDHDYSAATRKRTHSYIVPPLDDDWPPLQPPPRKKAVVMATNNKAVVMATDTNNSRLGSEPLQKGAKQLVVRINGQDGGDRF